MLVRSLIKRMNSEEKRQILDGGFAVGLMTGLVSYHQYRQYKRKNFLRSEGHHRFEQPITNLTPWKAMYFTWHRMPKEEFDVYHKFKPYFIIGQVDYSKEVLIPREKYVNGKKQKGYDVINPLYCYEGGKLSMRKALQKEDPITIERSALILNRGWVPYAFKDKRSRPMEVNSQELVRVIGTFRKSKNVHEYTIPNDPDANEWHNLCCEDIGIYWDLPNFDESKYYYFHAVAVGASKDSLQTGPATPVVRDSMDEVIESHYGWYVSEWTHKQIATAFGAVSAASFAIATLV